MNRSKLVIVGALLFLVYFATHFGGSDAPGRATKASSPSSPAPAASGSVAATPPAVQAAKPVGWEYSVRPDKMTGRRVPYAELDSADSLDLEFPYSGRNEGRLTVRLRDRNKPEVVFDVEKGQILCPAHGDCSLRIRFDEGAPVRYSGNPPTDRTPRVVFLRDAKSFIARASKAHVILVEATYFQNGVKVLTFRTDDPLKWNPAQQLQGESENAKQMGLEKCPRASGIQTRVSIEDVLDARNLMYTFIGKAPPNPQVEAMLRQCLQIAGAQDKTKSILASAWIRGSASSDPLEDKQIQLFPPLHYLELDSKTGEVTVKKVELKKK